MKRNTLFALVALALSGIGVAQAQDFSSWYVAPRIGVDVPDSGRDTKTSAFFGIGVGTWYNPNFAIDLEYGINNADYKTNSVRNGHQWESVQLDVAGRWFFGELGSGWRPYFMAGIGALRHKAYSGQTLGLYSFSKDGGWDPMATIGVGVQYSMSDRLSFRGEVAARYDRDNNSRNPAFTFPQGVPANPPALFGIPHHSGFTDGIVSIGLTYSFGHAAVVQEKKAEVAPPPPPPPPPPRETPVFKA